MKKSSEVSFDLLLGLALRENARREMAALPTPDQLRQRYPDTARWDARLRNAREELRPRRKGRLLRRFAVVLAVLAALLAGALTVSAELRGTLYRMVMEWRRIEVQITYELEGEPELTELPAGYREHYIPEGFVLDEENVLDFSYAQSRGYDESDVNRSFNVHYIVIQPEGQVEVMDNEHTVYTTMELEEGVEATLGIFTGKGGYVSYYLFWEKGGIHHTVDGNIPLDELLKVARSIY